jgi:hypothetical protein
MSLTTKEKLSSIKRYHQAKFSSPVVHRRLTELLRIRAVNLEAASLLGWTPTLPPTSASQATQAILPVPNNLFELKEIKQEEGTEYNPDSTILVPLFQTASNHPVKEEPIEEEAFKAIKEEAVDPQEQRAPFSEFHLEWYLDDIYVRFPGASPQEAEELLVQVVTQELALLNLGHI